MGHGSFWYNTHVQLACQRLHIHIYAEFQLVQQQPQEHIYAHLSHAVASNTLQAVHWVRPRSSWDVHSSRKQFECLTGWESGSLPWLPLGWPHPALPRSAYHFLFSRRPSHRIQAANAQLSADLRISYHEHVFVLFPACLAHSQAGHWHAVKQ